MSYDNSNYSFLTPLEQAAGLWGILYGGDNGECSCGCCNICERRRNENLVKQKTQLENSVRFKDATKHVAGVSGNRKIKLALIHKVHRDSLDSAIVRYMSKEELPEYYASIIKNSNFIDIILEGILYKVCKIKIPKTLSKEIGNLSSSLRINPSRLTAYDRVTLIQRFIHHTADQYLGAGAAQSIPVAPMKNTLSAARLHLSIIDVIDQSPRYVAYIDGLSIGASRLEYVEPRPSTAPVGKISFPKWRVRHLRPFSYYFPIVRQALLQKLNSLDENIPSDQFSYEAVLLYANV